MAENRKKILYVRVTQCSIVGWWYRECIGVIFPVTSMDKETYECLDGCSFIKKNDAEPVKIGVLEKP